MCEHGDDIIVRVKIPADLAADGIEKWKQKPIDSCIAPIVKALQAGGVDMRGSCCGHGTREGEIALQDGRGLLVLSVEHYTAWLAHTQPDRVPPPAMLSDPSVIVAQEED